MIAPVEYTQLVFTAALGFALFGEIPDGAMYAGAAIIVASTLYITVREVRVKRDAETQKARASAIPKV